MVCKFFCRLAIMPLKLGENDILRNERGIAHSSEGLPLAIITKAIDHMNCKVIIVCGYKSARYSFQHFHCIY